MRTAMEDRYIRAAADAIQREVVSTPPSPSRAYPMELRCPNCGGTDLKKVSLIYEEGSSRIKAKSRLRGLSLGDDGPSVFAGTAATNGINQTLLSERLRPPQKWSYVKLLLWTGLVAIVSLVVCVHMVMSSSSAVSSVPFVMGVVVGLAAFVATLIGIWRHNQSVYPRQFAEWEKSFLCQRCGELSSRGPLGARSS
jgi:hypothetical protein